MIETNELIWISPILSQAETETLYQWVNLHLTESRLKPIISFSKIRVEFLTEPKEALKLNFEVMSLGVENSLDLFKEAIWSEILVGSTPGPKPYALSFQSKNQIGRPKKLICFDMDSTLINEEVIDEIARQAGFYEEVSKITESAMQGNLDFKASLRERVKLFAGMPKAGAEAIISALTLSPGADKLISQFRFKGIKVAVVSGGFQFILKHFQKSLFLDHVFGNSLFVDEDECFTGEVQDPIVDADFKRMKVVELKEHYHAASEETVVVGDGANDIPMMGVAGVSVSFCGKPKLAAHTNTLILDRDLRWIKPLL
jgi:phosphoserine phosphatase SerB